VTDLPPSAKYVAAVIEREGEATRQELIRETSLPERTLDRALHRLEDAGRIVKTRESGSLRRTVAKVAGERRFTTEDDG